MACLRCAQNLVLRASRPRVPARTDRSADAILKEIDAVKLPDR